MGDHPERGDAVSCGDGQALHDDQSVSCSMQGSRGPACHKGDGWFPEQAGLPRARLAKLEDLVNNLFPDLLLLFRVLKQDNYK